MPRVIYVPCILMPVVLVSFVTSVLAGQIVGTKLKDLMVAGVWVSEDHEFGNWDWAGDNTVCLRLPQPTDPCADTGTWTIEDDAICYKLTWWGSASGVQENCFTVNVAGNDRYETVYHGGAMASTMFFFDVLE